MVVAGGGSTRPVPPSNGGQMTIDPPRQSQPDLSVVSPTVSNNAPVIGTNFDRSTTVTNQGDRASVPTTLRFYGSTDPTITTQDVLVGTKALEPLAEVGSRSEIVPLTAPPDPGTYYYGACVDAVAGEPIFQPLTSAACQW